MEKPLTTVEYDYPTFHLSMQCFLCKVERSNLTLLEHEAARWLSYDELDDVDWLPADRVVVKELRHYLQSKRRTAAFRKTQTGAGGSSSRKATTPWRIPILSDMTKT